MPIQLADLTLNRVHRITTLEQSAFVHHRVPGAAGDVLQDMGRRSVRLRIDGICVGGTAKDDLDKLRGLYIAREPVDFIADVVGQTYVSRVALDRLEVWDSADEPGQFSWTVTVSEYVEPPQRDTAAMDAVNASITADAAALMDVASLPDALALGSLPEISNPFVPLNGALAPVAEGAKALDQSMAGLKILFGI
ncbi:MAG TPA: DNA circularization N-terminal domain-containing protein [Longimicrobium sp.]|nr:DNA circularization N-terminal domain-containing protein [Longimicrobium sp.]